MLPRNAAANNDVVHQVLPPDPDASGGLVRRGFPGRYEVVNPGAVEQDANDRRSVAGGTSTTNSCSGQPEAKRQPKIKWATVKIPQPAKAPTTVPLIRMNCRSLPTCSSILREVSSASQRATVSVMTAAISER